MKKTAGILFGGKSTEHEISVISAGNVFNNLDRELFDAVLMFIDKSGKWFYIPGNEFPEKGFVPVENNGLLLDLTSGKGKWITADKRFILQPDVIFPVLHGPNGEDGSMQGLLRIAGIPFAGPGVLGSAAAMDKEVTKKLLEMAGIGVARCIYLKQEDYKETDLENVVKQLGLPLVIKPANAGSSVGISKVKNLKELIKAIELAFEYDIKILVEECITGREIECAVLGNENPVASIPGEIVTEFYDYEAKYLSDTKAQLKAPAELDVATAAQIRETAIRAYKAVGCEGMSRVDFFLTGDRLLVNEINTIPGFTNISMYPKLFELTGIPNKELITRLLNLAMERFERDARLRTRFTQEV